MKDKITIGLFIDTFFPMIDGVAMVVDNYAKRLSKMANVVVFAPGYKKSGEFDDSKLSYKVVRCKSLRVPMMDYSLPLPSFDSEFKKQLKDTNLDIIHIHSPFSIGKTGVNYAKKHNLPLISTMHSQYKQDFLRAVKFKKVANILTKNIIKQYDECDKCWAVNDEIAKIYFNDYHCKQLPDVMNNATDMLPVENLEEAKQIVNETYNIDKEEKVFLFVGRINNLKNVFMIANSLKILKEKYDFKFKMLFVGTGQDEEKLKNIIEKNNMKQDIIMCGRVEDKELLKKIYSRADLFLFPSLYDASSIVQIEAASQKTPTLFVKGAATAATITDNVNGFICENDEEKYADKIIEIMNNEALYETVCENVYRDIYVNWDTRINQVYELYCKFIEDKKINK